MVGLGTTTGGKIAGIDCGGQVSARHTAAGEWSCAGGRAGRTTSPDNTATVRHVGCERDRIAEYSLVDIITERHVDATILDTDLADVTALRVRSQRRHPRSSSISGRQARLVICVYNGNFGAGTHVESLGDLRPNGICLIGRDRERSQNADNCDNDHQFNQRESLLESLHCFASLVSPELQDFIVYQWPTLDL